MIYLDNAATTLYKPPEVKEEIRKGLEEEYGNPGRGLNGPSLKTLKKIYELRMKIKDVFGGESPQKIVLSPGITWSLNLVLHSLIQPGDHILTTVWEHNSVLRPLYSFEKIGAEITFLPMKDGYPDLHENSLKNNTRFLVVTAASNVLGNAIDLKAYHDFAKAHHLIFIVDGAQGLGTINQNLKDMDQIIYCFTGHKGLHGPTGTGGIIIKGQYNFLPVFSGGSGYQSFEKTQPLPLPGIFEPGTLPFHSLFGLEGAINAWEKEKQVYEKLGNLRTFFIHGLSMIPNVTVYGSKNDGAPVVSCNIGERSSQEVADHLWNTYQIACRSGSHCAPLTHTYLQTAKQGTIRFSFSHQNTIKELSTVLEILETIGRGGVR